MTKTVDELKKKLRSINGRDYGAYQSLKGEWSYPNFTLIMERIPKDPFAPPFSSLFRVRISKDVAGFPSNLISSKVREVAFRDYLSREFYSTAKKINKGIRGTGNSGIITISKSGQSVLERTSILIDDDQIEARCFISLPANGRRVKAEVAETMLLKELPAIVSASLMAKNLDVDGLQKHVETVEDTDFIRNSLDRLGLLAFVGDDSILPRRSGVEDSPLKTDEVVKFKSPESLRITIELPNAGKITGMGLPKGVTLIVGGGYHGKSTLLEAIELGIYNKVAGDGRETVASIAETVKIKASSGRSVASTDISAFINNIPGKKITTSFSTPNASGSTSQAAFISESIEVGAKVLLMDEDTCATNFMVRDKRMQELVAKDDEPITSFVDKVNQLYSEHEISTILVMGGSGDYFNKADKVIQMTNFQPIDVTDKAHLIAKKFVTDRMEEGGQNYKKPASRFPTGGGLDPYNNHGRLRISAKSLKELQFGNSFVELSDIDQLAETSQVKAIGLAIEYSKRYMDGKTTLQQISEQVLEDIRGEGMDILDGRLMGDLSLFRVFEFVSVLNRIRTLKIK